MSKFVDEIIKSIHENKNDWSKCADGSGVKKGKIAICQCGGPPILSIVHIIIDDQDMPLTFMDKYRVEKAVSWWYRNIDLQQALIN